MKFDQRWLLVVAAACAAAGLAVADGARRRRLAKSHQREQARALRAWENEGGNLAPIPAALALP